MYFIRKTTQPRSRARSHYHHCITNLQIVLNTQKILIKIKPSEKMFANILLPKKSRCRKFHTPKKPFGQSPSLLIRGPPPPPHPAPIWVPNPIQSCFGLRSIVLFPKQHWVREGGETKVPFCQKIKKRHFCDLSRQVLSEVVALPKKNK